MKKILLYLLILLSSTSCTDWLTVEPENEIAKDRLFTTEEGFWQALNGTYSLLRNRHSPSGFFTSSEVDYLVNTWTVGSESTLGRLAKYEYRNNSVDDLLGDGFLDQYNVVANANTILEYLNTVDKSVLTENAYNLIKAEAISIRAWILFDMIRLYGPMPQNVDNAKRYLPYVKSVSTVDKEYITYNDYIKNLKADLDTAQVIFEKYDPLMKYSCAKMNTNQYNIDNYDRLEYYYRQNHMNYYAVTGLKARLALWMNDKEKALEIAKSVIDATDENNTPMFTLATSSSLNYSTSGADGSHTSNTLTCEQLFGNYCTNFNFTQYLTGLVVPTERLDDLYESDMNDFRYHLWTCYPANNSSNGTKDGYMPFKYRDAIVWVPKIRLAEMYLIVAECAPLEEANSAYKTLCDSRGCAYQEFAEADRQSTIIREYYKEFIAEGQLFYLNKRLSVKRTLWGGTTTMSEAQYVLPIPKRESEILN